MAKSKVDKFKRWYANLPGLPVVDFELPKLINTPPDVVVKFQMLLDLAAHAPEKLQRKWQRLFDPDVVGDECGRQYRALVHPQRGPRERPVPDWSLTGIVSSLTHHWESRDELQDCVASLVRLIDGHELAPEEVEGILTHHHTPEKMARVILAFDTGVDQDRLRKRPRPP